MGMTINWFPGHMAKTRRQIQESLKLVDAVIEIRDARIVKSSANPQIDEICKDKPRVILLNKSDLDGKIERDELQNLKSKYITNISAKTGQGLDAVKEHIKDLFFTKTLGCPC